jgi:hypothetical protein
MENFVKPFQGNTVDVFLFANLRIKYYEKSVGISLFWNEKALQRIRIKKLWIKFWQVNKPEIRI